MTLKVFPTEFEIYDDEAKLVLGTIKAFDEASLDVEIKQIMSAKDMADLAAVMEKIEQMHKDGIIVSDESKTWDNAFKKKAEQMGDTITKEFE